MSTYLVMSTFPFSYTILFFINLCNYYIMQLAAPMHFSGNTRKDNFPVIINSSLNP